MNCRFSIKASIFICLPFYIIQPILSQKIGFLRKYDERVYLYKEVFQEQTYLNIKNSTFHSLNYPRIGYGIDYKFITLSFSKAVKVSDKLKHENFSFGYGASYKRFRAYINYKKNILGNNYNLKQFETKLYIIPNYEYVNFNSSFFFNEQQIKTGGSLVLGIGLQYFKLHLNDSNIIDNQLNVELGYLFNIVLTKRLSLSSNINYTGHLATNKTIQGHITSQLSYLFHNFFSGVRFKASKMEVFNRRNLVTYEWRFILGLRFF